ncbi:MAG: FAD-binding protein [Candidatus Eremiobacteraeota bacterium]|nr:FAD-binding protein [Candidatus Eremiobacteraeota bacterium]
MPHPEKNPLFDVAIIGAGPAGATLARLIGKSHRTLLVDSRSLRSSPLAASREKCCGGLLSPDAQNMLARMGLGVPLSVLVGPQLFTVRTIDLERSRERFYQRHYINVDREAFDRYLLSLIPEEVDIRCPALLKSLKEEGDGVSLTFRDSTGTFREKARVVVGADGAWSRVRRHITGGKDGIPLYIAIQEWNPVPETPPYFSVVFNRHVTDFYGWTIPKEDRILIGAALRPGSDAWRRFRMLKEMLCGLRLGNLAREKTRGAFIARPLKASHLLTGRAPLFLIGEAAGFISPTSAEGLSFAFRSALAMGEALQRIDNGLMSRYKSECRSLITTIRLKFLKLPFMYNPYLRSLVMASGLKSMKLCRDL